MKSKLQSAKAWEALGRDEGQNAERVREPWVSKGAWMTRSET